MTTRDVPMPRPPVDERDVPWTRTERSLRGLVPWWLGALNFLVLQWFGVRLARVVERRPIPNDIVGAYLFATGAIAREEYMGRAVAVGWDWVRWLWPLTGWWSRYRWISRPDPVARATARRRR